MVEKAVEEVQAASQSAMMYPWQAFPSYPPNNISPAIPQLPAMPSPLAKHPQLWSKEEVSAWLQWCEEEYSIVHISADKFNMNGKALCVMMRSDFMERVPDAGDILYNVLQKLISRNSGPMLYQPLPTYPAITAGLPAFSSSSPCPLPAARREGTFVVVPGNTSRLNPPQPRSNYIPILPDLKKAIQQRDNDTKYPVPITAYRIPDTVLSPAPSAGSDSGQSDHTSENASPPSTLDHVSNLYHDSRVSHFPKNGMTTESDMNPPQTISLYKRSPSDNITPVWREKNSDCRLLWEFINYLLVNGSYTDFIRWEDQDKLTFRIINPTALAELWGIQKNRTNMTYEKLSRALRYYYKMNIIKKVQGKRLTYQFLRQPKDIKKGQRGARPQPRPPPSHLQYPVPLPNVNSPEEQPCNLESPYRENRVFRESSDRPEIKEEMITEDNMYRAAVDHISVKEERMEESRGGLKGNDECCAFNSSPSPSSQLPKGPSLDSVAYNGTADVVTFPIQDEPEDLSVKVAVQDKLLCKENDLVVKHDVNSNLTKALNEFSDSLPSVLDIKKDPDSSDMKIKS